MARCSAKFAPDPQWEARIGSPGLIGVEHYLAFEVSLEAERGSKFLHLRSDRRVARRAAGWEGKQGDARKERPDGRVSEDDFQTVIEA